MGVLPKVFDDITDHSTKETYIVQKKLPGTLLSTIIHTLDRSTLLKIASELHTFLEEFSKLDGGGNRLGLIGRPGCFGHGIFYRYDWRICGGGCMEGIQTTEEFVRWIENYTSHGASREQRDQWMNDFQFHLSTIFSHGDLQPENIFVNEGYVSGITDWECAG
jgi:thiamine kinase-like enzyme